VGTNEAETAEVSQAVNLSDRLLAGNELKRMGIEIA
jgi:hypothetical protein